MVIRRRSIHYQLEYYGDVAITKSLEERKETPSSLLHAFCFHSYVSVCLFLFEIVKYRLLKCHRIGTNKKKEHIPSNHSQPNNSPPSVMGAFNGNAKIHKSICISTYCDIIRKIRIIRIVYPCRVQNKFNGFGNNVSVLHETNE